MINITRGNIVFNVTGQELDCKVRSALDAVATALVRLYGCESVDLSTVTTKTHLKLAYVKFVRLCILVRTGVRFDETYIQDSFEANSQAFGPLTEEAFYRLTLSDPDGPYAYRPSYRGPIHLGTGLFLVALHVSGAITLPFDFSWPISWQSDRSKREVAKFIGSELIILIRAANGKPSPYSDALQWVLTHKRRREWFLSLGTKMMLALGWNRPEDVNLEELINFKEADDATNFTRKNGALPYRALVDVLERQYGDKVAISVRSWAAALRASERRQNKTLQGLSNEAVRESIEVFAMRPSDALPERLSRISSLPGLDEDLSLMSKTWLSLQTAYFKKLRRESVDYHLRAIGFFNLYLFFYLPYWFDENQESRLIFPSAPKNLLAGIFVSRLLPPELPVPLTYMEFIQRYAQDKGWKPSVLSSNIKCLEQFFDFLERYSTELPGCDGFKQPISRYDFPRVAQSSGTNKRPVPRRIFSFYLAYVEALVSYTHVVLERVLAGEISDEDVGIFHSKRYIIDTVRASSVVGYVPMVFFRGKAHTLNIIPNCIDLGVFKLKDGRTLRIPQPHGLHHVLVAIYTGIRNQHIQWLDARSFDSRVRPDDGDITKLLVNTDKVLSECWEPYVNMRVIDILREQLRWRNLIDMPGFNQEIYYERNVNTKWPRIQPLFAVEVDGYPHPDSRYAYVWSRILMGVQGMVSEIDCGRVAPLFDLLPPDVPYRVSDRSELLNQYKNWPERKIDLLPKTDITPHSARVGVVSNLITVLPAELIGRYVTGQQSGVVYHYVYIDEDDMRVTQEQHAVSLQVRAFGKEFDTLVEKPLRANPHFIKADEVNSKLAQAMQKNMDEAIVSYGCVTLLLREDGKSGIDVLRETRGSNAAFNKTEVCPFANQCPPDVLKELRGIGRCGMCPYAVRSIDHLPAVMAKVKQVAEQLDAIEQRLDMDDSERRFSERELEQFEAERQRIGDELTAWKLASEVLEVQRRLLDTGQDSRRWVVAKPEILEQSLQRVAVPTGDTEYVLARLAESVAYPTFDSPEVKARFDLLRRQLLANVGNIRAALTSPQPPDVAAQCAGLLRTVVEANGLDYGRVVALLSTDKHMQSLPEQQAQLLLKDE